MEIKNYLLLILGIGLANVITATNHTSTKTHYDIDEFYIDVPLEDDDLAPFDTSNIPGDYSHIILNKTVNCYAFYEEDLEGAAMIIRTVYIRNLEGVAYFLDRDLSDKTKYGITIFKKDGTRKHFTDEIKSSEFRKEVKKHIRPGDIIRYYYTYNLSRLYNYSFFLSESAPVLDCRFIMQAEDKIEYTAKGFNGMTSTMDSTIEDFQILEFKGNNLPIVRDEINTASNVSMAKVIYGLTYFKQATSTKLFDFNYARIRFHDIYNQKDYAIDKITAKNYNDLNIKDSDSDDEKVQKIDDYMKKEYRVFDFFFSGISFNIFDVLGSNYITPDNAVKYYKSYLRLADVEVEIALLPSRLDNKFDKSFETWEYFDYVSLYVPETKKYLHPKSNQLKYGDLPSVVKDNKALYILEHKFGDIKTAKFVTRTLKTNGHEENIDSLHITLDLSGEGHKAHFTQSYQGDFAVSFNNAYDEMFFDDKENLFSNSCKRIDQKAKPILDSYELTNSKEEGFAVSGDFISNGLNTNSKTIQIGALLGKKDVLSSVEERQADFAILPQTKIVQIEITLANGVKATNLADFNKTYTPEDKVGVSYVLTAKQEGNKVIINLEEVFEKIVYEKNEYPSVKGLYDVANQVYSKQLILQ